MAFFNTIAFTFFCFLLSFPSSTQTPSPPPPSSAHAAAVALRNRGYSLFASTIDSTNNNFSGTIFAPPDFIFSANIRPSPPRPSSLLLRYHTLKTPLTWVKLFSNDVNGVQTLYNNNCLFFFKSSTGQLSISSTQNSIGFVKIRQPDIYVDNHLTVHGIDGVLDPTSARKCSVQTSVIIQSERHRRSLLDHAIRALRRRRFTVAATALTIKRPELLTLASVSLFAPSDMVLFSQPQGFHYDYRHHVVPQRYRFGDLASTTLMVFQTLAPNKTLVVNFNDGVLTVNGVIVNSTEVYRNRWIVVLSVSMSLDDAGYLLDSGSFVPSPSPATMDIRFPDERINCSVKSPSPATMEIRYPDEIINPSVESPSPETMGFDYPDEINIPSVESPSSETMRFGYPDEIHNAGVPASMDMYYPEERIDASVGRSQSPLGATMDERIKDFSTSVESPSPATMKDSWCVFGLEGGDLLCQASSPSPRKEDVIEESVAEYVPSDVKDESVPLISEEDIRIGHNHEDHLNIANDLFFYL
ncbi:hypothetical protein KY290_033734 [Solanum tuberosum]|uniref:FAS1 domain-containing protein n=1 Tax=Solanum tuberosum TaxID=4113 RepID=A0ABQ7U1J5_SOLTU|nr:hypothetical protein KY289_033108 [Solanum tuberosum]KAH0649275.1 hypothetical protein KY285_034523 [Solanum tuberosum]KAH0740691.1 hypothetical protein KY290_033734 [Solanum tuberosum]